MIESGQNNNQWGSMAKALALLLWPGGLFRLSVLLLVRCSDFPILVHIHIWKLTAKDIEVLFAGELAVLVLVAASEGIGMRKL